MTAIVARGRAGGGDKLLTPLRPARKFRNERVQFRTLAILLLLTLGPGAVPRLAAGVPPFPGTPRVPIDTQDPDLRNLLALDDGRPPEMLGIENFFARPRLEYVMTRFDLENLVTTPKFLERLRQGRMYRSRWIKAASKSLQIRAGGGPVQGVVFNPFLRIVDSLKKWQDSGAIRGLVYLSAKDAANFALLQMRQAFPDFDENIRKDFRFFAGVQTIVDGFFDRRQ